MYFNNTSDQIKGSLHDVTEFNFQARRNSDSVDGACNCDSGSPADCGAHVDSVKGAFGDIWCRE